MCRPRCISISISSALWLLPRAFVRLCVYTGIICAGKCNYMLSVHDLRRTQTVVYVRVHIVLRQAQMTVRCIAGCT